MSGTPNAAVHIEDRGYQFADGVYEVCEVARGFIMDMTRHLDRLNRSLGELEIAWPMSRKALQTIMREVVKRNHVVNGLVYLQVTRGVASRDHVFPGSGQGPALVVTAKRSDPAAALKRAETGIKVITVPENRWDRVDIKTVGLLPNVLAKQKAKLAGAYEAWFVDPDGTVKEGASTNAWIVTRDGKLVTRPAEQRHPARHHPHHAFRPCRQARARRSRSAASRSPRPRRRAKPSSRPPRPSSCRSSRSTATPVANGHPGSIALSLRSAFFDVAEKTRA